jgi:hypothetical protein
LKLSLNPVPRRNSSPSFFIILGVISCELARDCPGGISAS